MTFLLKSDKRFPEESPAPLILTICTSATFAIFVACTVNDSLLSNVSISNSEMLHVLEVSVN